MSDGYTILTLDEVETASHRGSNLIPVRHTLGFGPAGVNAWIADALARRRFRVTAPGRFEAALEEDGNLLSFLRPVALDAAELLEDEVSRDLVRICEERQVGRCDWLFVDTSRNHTRRFCSMQECGNRAKVAAHRQRARAFATADR